MGTFHERRLSKGRLAVFDFIRRSREGHATVGGCFEWDITDTLERIARDRARGRDVGLAAFMVKASAATLVQHPRLNSRLFYRWFKLYEVSWEEVSCNLVVARDGPDGRSLLLPAVIRNADQQSIEEVHRMIRRWKTEDLSSLDEAAAIDRVRSAPRVLVKLFNWMLRRKPSFVIERFGTYGLSVLVDETAGEVAGQAISPTTSFYPASIALKPWVLDGVIVPRKLITMAILVDHYIVDGLEVTAAGRTLRRLVEEPDHLLGPE